MSTHLETRSLSIPGDPDGAIIYDVMAADRPSPESTLLVLVNGYQRDRKDFRALRKRLHERLPELVTVSLDNRGVGETKTTQSFHLDDMAHDVLRLTASLQQEHNPRTCFLLGISMGGMIAQLAASQATGLETPNIRPFDGVALISTTGGGELRSWSEATRRHAGWPAAYDELKKRVRSYFGTKFKESAPLLIDAMAKNIHKTAQNPEAKGRAKAQHEASKSFDGSKALGALRALGTPALIVTGDEDHIMPDANSLALKQQLGDRARLMVYPGVGHLILIEEPILFANDIEDFLRRTQP